MNGISNLTIDPGPTEVSRPEEVAADALVPFSSTSIAAACKI